MSSKFSESFSSSFSTTTRYNSHPYPNSFVIRFVHYTQANSLHHYRLDPRPPLSHPLCPSRPPNFHPFPKLDNKVPSRKRQAPKPPLNIPKTLPPPNPLPLPPKPLPSREALHPPNPLQSLPPYLQRLPPRFQLRVSLQPLLNPV